jgi:hypothetical protein
MSQTDKQTHPEATSGCREMVCPAIYCDPVIQKYKHDIDHTILRENLKLSVEERFIKFERFMELVEELQQAGKKARLAGLGNDT